MRNFKSALLIVFILIISTTSSLAAEQRYNLPVENSPFIGNANAPVTIIEFIDYQ